MNFHVVKWENLVFIPETEYLSIFMLHTNFLHKFEQRLSYIARAWVEKYTVLENDLYNDLLLKRQGICTLTHEN